MAKYETLIWSGGLLYTSTDSESGRVTLPHQFEIEENAYAIGVSKHIPNSAANLAYMSAPEITSNDVGVSSAQTVYSSPYTDTSDLHIMSGSNTHITAKDTANLLITNVFSFRRTPEDKPVPLWYKSQLDYQMADISGTYAVCYNELDYTEYTEQELTDVYTVDNGMVHPLIHAKIYNNNGKNQLLTIEDDIGILEKENFRIILVKDNSTLKYDVYIYHSLDITKPHYVRYVDHNGLHHTELLSSIRTMEERPYEEPPSLAENTYSINRDGEQYKIYVSDNNGDASITDVERAPFRFKYRVYGNYKDSITSITPKTFKIGMLYFGTTIDAYPVLQGLFQSIGAILPDYIDFINPYPPAIFEGGSLDNRYTSNYWEVDLKNPQELLNEYDIILITGYSSQDLSVYNSKLAAYLNNGGCIIIDSLGNSLPLDINFGSTDPIAVYSFGSTNSNSKVWVETGDIQDRYYTGLDPNQICHIENSVPVSPAMTITGGVWNHVVSYTSGTSIAYMEFDLGGKLYLSNCGVFKDFAVNNSLTTASKFATNLLFTILENRWEATDWLYDRVHYRSQLHPIEYSKLGYYDEAIGLTTVATRILQQNIADIFSREMDTYTVEYHERISGIFTTPANIVMNTSLVPGDMLTVYATNNTNTSYLADTTLPNIVIANTVFSTKCVIIPFTYVWRLEGSTLLQRRINNSEIKVVDISCQYGEHISLLFNSYLPNLDGGAEWSNRSQVYYEVFAVEPDTSYSQWTRHQDIRFNINIVNGATGQTYENRIGYEDLDGNVFISISTTAYELDQIDTKYAIVPIYGTEMKLPQNLNTNECWFPKIHGYRFIKTSQERHDYENFARLLSINYDKTYIAATARIYFGEVEPYISIIESLEADEDVSAENISLLAAAFDVNDLTTKAYVYENITGFYAYTYPGIDPTDNGYETPKYIQSNKIRVENTPLIYDSVLRTNDVLTVSDESVLHYTGTFDTDYPYIEPSYPTQIEEQIGGNWFVVQTSNYNIDYTSNTIVFKTAQSNPLRMTRLDSNINIVRLSVSPATTIKQLIKVSITTYTIPNATNHRIVQDMPLKLYTISGSGSYEELSVDWYYINPKYNTITISEPISKNLYLEYTYSQVESIGTINADPYSGVITIDRDIHFNDLLQVDYTYYSNYVNYKGYEDDDDGMMELDINPTRGHVTTQRYVNDTDTLVLANRPSYYIVDKTIYIYALPSVYIDYNGNEIITNSPIRHTFNETEYILLQIANPEIMPLGSVKIMDNYTVHDVEVLDTRSRGGGIASKVTTDWLQKNAPLALNFWDISPFDVYPYRPNGITIIEIPRTVLKPYGGDFTENEVTEIINKHVALGIRAIIEYV